MNEKELVDAAVSYLAGEDAALLADHKVALSVFSLSLSLSLFLKSFKMFPYLKTSALKYRH